MSLRFRERPALGRFSDGQLLPKAAQPLLGRVLIGSFWALDNAKRTRTRPSAANASTHKQTLKVYYPLLISEQPRTCRERADARSTQAGAIATEILASIPSGNDR